MTGTGTGVGKTVLSAAIVASLRAGGEPVRAYKPVVTGLEEEPGPWPRDHELLASLTGQAPEEVAPLTFGPPSSPHLAASLAGVRLDLDELVAGARRAAGVDNALVVEGVGGLLVPLGDDFAVRELACALGLPVVVAADPGLGTINHTLLTLQAAGAAGLDVRAVVLTPWPAGAAGAIERSNRETIARCGAIEVAVLAEVSPAGDPEALAAAGATLGCERWLGESDRSDG